MIQVLNGMVGKKVLIAPLDWGLGHAARCIPIINQLLKQENEVILAGAGSSLLLLTKEFPDLETIQLPEYDVKYNNTNDQTFTLIKQVPRIWKVIKRERKIIHEQVLKKGIQIIISDNRYGVYNKSIPSFFITHQLRIFDVKNRKWMEWLMRKVNFSLIKNFTECWVPDYAGENNLSGDLSHNIETPFPIQYIGTLSRFKDKWLAFSLEKTYKIIILLSGPEPQKSLFQKIIFSQIDLFNVPTLVCLGNPNDTQIRRRSSSIDTVGHLSSDQMYHVLFNCELVISRSGYTTLMDLESLGKKAILVPTPGQSEQEYLAKIFKEKKLFFSEEQSTFHVDRAIKENEKYKGWIIY